MVPHCVHACSAEYCHPGYLMCTGLGWRKVYRVHDTSEDDLDPFPFHICNVAMHAAVTCLVYLLAMRLCRVRDAPWVSGSWQHRLDDSTLGESGASGQQGGWGNTKGAARHGLRHRRSSISTEHEESHSMHRNQSCGTSSPGHACLHLATCC